MDPVGALIGTILIGLGSLVLYGAVKNKKVFGAKGLLPTALSTGSLAKLETIPEAFSTDIPKATNSSPLEDAMDKVGDLLLEPETVLLPRTVRQAVFNIGETDSKLATQIAGELNSTDGFSKRAELNALAHLLVLADAKGHKSDADVIRKYIETRNGESI